MSGMYYQYFGLSEAPFSIAVNPRYLYMSHRHRDALAHLLYGVGVGGGFILLTGEVGTGKTTINRALLAQLPDKADIAIVLNPALDAAELLAAVCDELAIAYEPADAASLKALTDRLHRFLLDNHARGRRTVLLIDEAQHLSFDVLEQIRLLTNLETDSEKLLQIILTGQPELATMLARPELRQLNQRITARYNLEPLSAAETAAYIRHRLQVAGLGPGTELFPPRVVRAIHRHTGGTPRLINLLCDRMLLGAYGQEAPRVDRSTLRQALGEVTGRRAPGARRRVLLSGGLVLAILLVVGLGWWALLRGAPDAPAVSPAPAAAARAWLLSPEEGLRGLWALQGGTPVPADPCGDTLRCESGRADTWQALASRARPLLLEMVTAERFAAAALLLDLGERTATLATPTGSTTVSLGELAPLWSGDFRFLWDAPAGFDGLLREGDSGPAVAEVAARFARLDGQERSLSDNLYNAALATRVRLFQRAEGLTEDGIVGAQTLQRLNVAAGLVPGAAARRERWDQLLAAGFQP